MIAQVEAGLPVLSDKVPAMMPPMMPPTSKMVDNIAASSASTCNMEMMMKCNATYCLISNLVHDMDIVGQPVEKRVGDQLGEEQAEKLVKH